MSAIYDDLARKAVRRQARGFTTMLGEPAEPVAGVTTEYSSSSLAHYVGSAFMTGAVFLYATHADPDHLGDAGKIFPVPSGQIFPLGGQTDTSTTSLGSPWVASEPQVYNSGVVELPWTRKVIYSGSVHFKTSQLPRREPRTIIADFLGEENG